LIFDGIERERLEHKCSGVFDNAVAHPHPLVAGLGDRVLVPHSRLNDVPTAMLDAHGYTTLLQARDTSWTVAVKRRSRCLFVLCQGHLEYGTDTLLREYRRDVRRFLGDESLAYPRVPVDYVDLESAEVLGAFRAGVFDGSESRGELAFPYRQIASRLVNSWSRPAEHFYANWLGHVAEQAHDARERVTS
jgi:homoserine O-succinyltransferase/O-acetyltransferase